MIKNERINSFIIDVVSLYVTTSDMLDSDKRMGAPLSTSEKASEFAEFWKIDDIQNRLNYFIRTAEVAVDRPIEEVMDDVDLNEYKWLTDTTPECLFYRDAFKSKRSSSVITLEWLRHKKNKTTTYFSYVEKSKKFVSDTHDIHRGKRKGCDSPTEFVAKKPKK